MKISDPIKKMADLLRSGNTMLNLACPVCNNPIFRKKGGNTFCPTCNREVIITSNNIVQNNKKQEIFQQNQDTEVFNSLYSIIIEKIEIINQKLKNENQIQSIDMYLSILTKCLDILKNLSFQGEKD